MKYILFCTNSYSFDILSPFVEIFKKKKYEWIWYIDKKIYNFFPFIDQNFTLKIIKNLMINWSTYNRQHIRNLQDIYHNNCLSFQEKSIHHPNRLQTQGLVFSNYRLFDL